MYVLTPTAAELNHIIKISCNNYQSICNFW